MLKQCLLTAAAASDVTCCVHDLLADSNPMVVANAVAALAEIQEVSGKDVFQITSQSLFKLLRALNECTEWGQVKMMQLIFTMTKGNCYYCICNANRATPKLCNDVHCHMPSCGACCMRLLIYRLHTCKATLHWWCSFWTVWPSTNISPDMQQRSVLLAGVHSGQSSNVQAS